MTAEPGTSEAEELALWALVVEDCEKRGYPIGPPALIGAIRFRMEQQGLTNQDPVPLIGSRSRDSEVLNGKRPLSRNMIRRLHEGLRILAEALLREPNAA